jgi:hypothetical protein
MTNVLREQMTKRAVAKTQAQKLEITIRNVSMFLPGPLAFDPELKAQEPFELDDDDLKPWVAAPTIFSETRSAPLPEPEVIEKPTPAPVLKPAAVRFAKLQEHAHELEIERNDLRYALDAAIRDELNAHHDLERVARSFVAGFARPTTPDELLKAHAESEAETRRKVANGELPARRRIDTTGPSRLDKFMAAQRGGNPAFAGRGYARGGLPVSRRLMPFGGAPKLPSER